MPTNYTSRIILTAAILLVAIWSIFPGMFKGQFRPDLKPGIDMVGGTSLLYEIKAAEGSTTDANIAERVMEALKKRVDPQGVRNLMCRSQGNRMEIQMPLSGRSGDSNEWRDAFYTAEGQLLFPTALGPMDVELEPGLYETGFRVDPNPLGVAPYNVELYMFTGSERQGDQGQDLLRQAGTFYIEANPLPQEERYVMNERHGLISLDLPWEPLAPARTAEPA
jgi:hypothetical protein